MKVTEPPVPPTPPPPVPPLSPPAPPMSPPEPPLPLVPPLPLLPPLPPSPPSPPSPPLPVVLGEPLPQASGASSSANRDRRAQSRMGLMGDLRRGFRSVRSVGGAAGAALHVHNVPGVLAVLPADGVLDGGHLEAALDEGAGLRVKELLRRLEAPDVSAMHENDAPALPLPRGAPEEILDVLLHLRRCRRHPIRVDRVEGVLRVDVPADVHSVLLGELLDLRQRRARRRHRDEWVAVGGAEAGQVHARAARELGDEVLDPLHLVDTVERSHLRRDHAVRAGEVHRIE